MRVFSGFIAGKMMTGAVALALVATSSLSLSSPAVAADAANNGAPVDLDAPETVIDSIDAERAVAQADAAAAALISSNAALSQRVIPQDADDTQFRSLFSAWQQMDGPRAEAIAIPSRRPVDAMSLTSRFGIRNDPFSGRRARHNGIDIPNPVGAPVYAAADGMIGRAQRLGGYGNYVEIDHGNAIQTRYGHLSAIAVASGQRVRRGDIIGYVGSTGRSTGPHLHYEVRIAGAPVNPLPFVADDGVMADASGHGRGNVALGGPQH